MKFNHNEVDFESYYQDYKITSKRTFVYLLLPFCSILVNSFFKELFTEKVVTPYLSKFPQNNLLFDFLFILIFVFTIVIGIRKFKSGLLPSLASILLFLIIYFIYIYIFKNENEFDFYSLKISLVNFKISYSNLLILNLLFLVIDFKPYSNKLAKNKSKKRSLIEDLTNTNIDHFNRTEYANEIVSLIHNSITEKSFSIGVFSEWGSGKSDFLHRLKDKFNSDKENNSNNILIEFNPWLSDGKTEIQENFFSLLSDALSPYDKSITKSIKNYSEKILKTSEKDIVKVIGGIIEEFIPRNTINDDRFNINQLIKRTGKRLVILIDDCDRLSGNEILQVFKLLRNTVDFNNTFFITTLDYDFVTNSLKLENEIAKPEEYLKKIFQLVIKLPIVTKMQLVTNFKEVFLEDFKGDQDFERINYLIKELSFTDELLEYVTESNKIEKSEEKYSYLTKKANNDGYIEELLQNPRDLKIFYNSFKLSYTLLGNEIEVIDLVLLELIKAASFDIYNRLSKKEFLVFKITDSNFSPNRPLLEDYLKAKTDISDRMKFVICQAVVKLTNSHLNNKVQKEIGQFSNPINFNLYFTYILPSNIISRKEFYEMLRSPLENPFYLSVNLWNETKPDDLKNILSSFPTNNFEEFKKIIKARLILSNKKNNRFNEHFREVTSFLYARLDIIKLLKFNKAEFDKYFIDLLEDNYLDHLIRAKIAVELRKNNMITQSKYNSSVFELFNSYLNDPDNIGDCPLEFYYLNKSKTVNDKIIIFKKASDSFRKFLLEDDRNFEAYLKIIIRPLTSPSNTTFVIEPFFRQYFPDINEFITKLDTIQLTDSNLIELKEFIQKQQPKIYSQNLSERVIDLKENKEDYYFLFNYLKQIEVIDKDDEAKI